MRDLIKSKKYYVHLKAHMLLHLVDVHLLKSEFDDAERVNFTKEVFRFSSTYETTTKVQKIITGNIGPFDADQLGCDSFFMAAFSSTHDIGVRYAEPMRG